MFLFLVKGIIVGIAFLLRHRIKQTASPCFRRSYIIIRI